MTDQKNTILAIVLSALVFVAWQYFFALPQIEKQKQDILAGSARLKERFNKDIRYDLEGVSRERNSL